MPHVSTYAYRRRGSWASRTFRNCRSTYKHKTPFLRRAKAPTPTTAILKSLVYHKPLRSHTQNHPRNPPSRVVTYLVTSTGRRLWTARRSRPVPVQTCVHPPNWAHSYRPK